MKRFSVLFFVVLFFTSFLYSQTVYVTSSGKKYHAESCSYLKSSNSIELQEAINKGYTPCSKCKPPTFKSSKYSTPSKTESKVDTQKNLEVTAGRCQATTKSGNQCKRKAKQDSKYCWQHQK